MNEDLPQPRRVEHSLPASCAHCKEIIYLERVVETVVEVKTDSMGKVVDQVIDRRRIVTGSFWQPVDEQGNETGAARPFCPKCTQDELLKE